MRSSVAVISAASVLVAGCITVPKDTAGPPGGSVPPGPVPEVKTEQSDPPEPTPTAEDRRLIEERWSCDDGDILLKSACSSGEEFCFGAVKIGEYPGKLAKFRIVGVERRWDWCLDGSAI